eukprot:7783436-Pyramimonas_sp.AAC.2
MLSGTRQPGLPARSSAAARPGGGRAKKAARVHLAGTHQCPLVLRSHAPQRGGRRRLVRAPLARV